MLLLVILPQFNCYDYLTRVGPDSILYSGQISKDGTIIVGADQAGFIYVYANSSGTFSKIQTISLPFTPYALDISDDAKLMVTSNSDASISIYYSSVLPPSYSLVQTIILSRAVSSLDVSISGDGNFIVVPDDNILRVYKNGGSNIFSLAYSDSNSAANTFYSAHFQNNVIVALYADKVIIYDYAASAFSVRNSFINPTSLAGDYVIARLSFDLSTLVLCGTDLAIYRKTGTSYSISQTMALHSGFVNYCQANQDGSVIASGSSDNSWYDYSKDSTNNYVAKTKWNEPNTVYWTGMSSNGDIIVTFNADGYSRIHSRYCISPKIYNQSNSCLTTCSVGYTYNSTNHCISCPNYILSNTCITTCPTDHYYNTSKYCFICDLYCLTCSAFTTCTTCHPGPIILISGACSPCDASCLTCSVAVTNCTACHPGPIVLSSGVCFTCDSFCTTCASVSTCATCNTNYWLDFVALTCATDCFTGQYKSLTTGLCALCSFTCLDCTISICNVCAAGYLMDPSNVCYVCKCPDCGNVCGASCIAGLFQLSAKCFGSCPPSYFIKGNFCSSCISPCQLCKDENTCVTCQQDFYFLKEKCYEQCPDMYFPKNKTCGYCLQGGVFQANQYCNSFIPKIKDLYTDSPSPFTSDTLILTFKSSRPILPLSAPGAFTIRVFQRSLDISSCFQITVHQVSRNLLKVKLRNLGCQISDIRIESEILTSLQDTNNLYFRPFTKTLYWELSSPQLNPGPVVLATEQMLRGKQYLRYFHFLPFFLIFLPSLRINVLLAFFTGVYPYQCHNIISLVASPHYDVGNFGFKSSGWNILTIFEGQNTAEYPMGTIGRAGNFLIDAYVPTFWFMLSGLLPILSTKLKLSSNLIYLSNSFHFKVIFGLSLLVCTGISSTARGLALNNDKLEFINTGLVAGGLITLVAVTLYMIYYLLQQVDRVLNLDQPDIELRYESVKSSLYMLQGLKWMKEQNPLQGTAVGLNPVFNTLVQLVCDIIIFILFSVLANYWLAQAVLILLYSTVNIVRFLYCDPFQSMFIKSLAVTRQLCIIAFMSLQTYTSFFYNSKLRLTNQRGLVQQQPLTFWLNMGYALSVLYMLILFLGITIDIRQYIGCCGKQNQFILLPDQIKDKDALKIKRVMMSTARINIDQIVQQEVQSAVFIRNNKDFFVKIVSKLQLRYSLQKEMVQTGRIVAEGRVINSAMTINKEHRLFRQLNFLLGKLQIQQCQKFTIKTIASLNLKDRMFGQLVEPDFYFNIVESGNAKAQLKGELALSWTPIIKDRTINISV